MLWQVTIGLRKPTPESRQSVSEIVSSIKARKKGVEHPLVDPISNPLIGGYDPRRCLFYQTEYEGHAGLVKSRLEGNPSVAEVNIEMVDRMGDRNRPYKFR